MVTVATEVINLFKRKKTLKRYIILIFLLAFVLLLIVSNRQISATVYEMAEVRSTQMATEAINNSVRAKITEENMRYRDLVEIHKDSGGRIVMIQANTAMINRISSETTQAAQSALLRLREDAFYIPLGQVTGVHILANMGPRMRVEVVPMGTVRVNVDDRFEQAGINQTRHSIYLNYDTDVRIVVPLKSGRSSVASRVPIAESIIIGEVPSTFVSLPEGFLGKSINR